ncbi:hypothetical protein GYMLUDRAFT_52432 [Collybiopsis luxurians FD-317 M1]|nr:hypothetical protein GYMLUDRAFT_52432 [Collybiopsis luxurians FD-317 M1]
MYVALILNSMLSSNLVADAALDAYAGYAVYSRLVKLFNLLEPTKRPKRRFYAFDCIRGTLYHCSGDEKRVLLGQPTGDSETTEYPSVAEEIFLHLQGVGTDQPRGLDPWAVSNSEYDPGPLPPKRTPEEKEKLRLERRKRREDSKIAEEQDAEAKANVETMEGRGIPESTTIRRVARAAAPRPSIGRINLDAGEGPSTARTSASSVRNTKLSPTSRTSGVADATMSMRAMKFAPESPTVEDRLPALSSSTSPQGSHRRRKHNRQNRKGPSKAGEKSRV